MLEYGTPAHSAEVSRLAQKIAWKQELTPTEHVFYRDFLLLAWEQSKQAIEAAKSIEMERRKAFVAFAGDPDKKSGTERVELENGYQAKIVKKLNYGFIKNKEDKTDKDAIENALQKIEAEGPVGELIAERLIKWTPDLSLTEYKQLSESHKAIIDAVIVVTDAAPTLEIVAPKGTKA